MQLFPGRDLSASGSSGCATPIGSAVTTPRRGSVLNTGGVTLGVGGLPALRIHNMREFFNNYTDTKSYAATGPDTDRSHLSLDTLTQN